jgi:hypothetical protein
VVSSEALHHLSCSSAFRWDKLFKHLEGFEILLIGSSFMVASLKCAMLGNTPKGELEWMFDMSEIIFRI